MKQAPTTELGRSQHLPQATDLCRGCDARHITLLLQSTDRVRNPDRVPCVEATCRKCSMHASIHLCGPPPGVLVVLSPPCHQRCLSTQQGHSTFPGWLRPAEASPVGLLPSRAAQIATAMTTGTTCAPRGHVSQSHGPNWWQGGSKSVRPHTLLQRCVTSWFKMGSADQRWPRPRVLARRGCRPTAARTTRPQSPLRLGPPGSTGL